MAEGACRGPRGVVWIGLVAWVSLTMLRSGAVNDGLQLFSSEARNSMSPGQCSQSGPGLHAGTGIAAFRPLLLGDFSRRQKRKKVHRQKTPIEHQHPFAAPNFTYLAGHGEVRCQLTESISAE